MRLKVISNQRWDVFPDTMYIVGDRAFSVVAARTWNGLIPRHDTSAFSISVVDDAKCIVVTRVCVSMCLCVCLSTAACLQYCMDPDVTWRSGRGCPVVVHCLVDLQSVHGLCCYGNITRTRRPISSRCPSHDCKVSV